MFYKTFNKNNKHAALMFGNWSIGMRISPWFECHLGTPWRDFFYHNNR